MRFAVIDIESYYDKEYTLKKLSTEEYIRDSRFEIYGAAIKWESEIPARYYDPRELEHILKDEDWSDTFLVSHHAQFDHLILSHHYGVVPAMSGCTLAMSRGLFGVNTSVSLQNIRTYFGMPPKTTPYDQRAGLHWNQLPPQTKEALIDGCMDEVESIFIIFKKLMAMGFPVEELEVIDTTIKMFSNPCLSADINILGQVWQAEAQRKKALMARLKVHEDDLQSSDRFAELLRKRGVEPQTKPGKKKDIYCFAKTDPFMEELLEHEDEEVRFLAEARQGAKSTLLQTRAETIGFMAQRGLVCCYLHYCGAHTSRWSGGDKTNFQNWTNGSDINKCLIAPDGFLIAEPDSSQVECRLLNKVAGQWDKIEEFRRGEDPYIAVSSAFYGFAVNKKDHPDERQLGKIVELQAGYQSGGEKIRNTIRIRSKGKIMLSAEQGVLARNAYRNTHPAVVKLWADAATILEGMLNWMSFDWGPLKITCSQQDDTRRVRLPNGLYLIYDTLENHYDEESNERYLRIKTRKGWRKIYGGAFVENCIQALARVVVSQAMIRLKHRGYRCVMTKHDSLWLLIPKDDRLEQHKQVIIEEMSVTPEWLPGVPLGAEFKTIGERYS